MPSLKSARRLPRNARGSSWPRQRYVSSFPLPATCHCPSVHPLTTYLNPSAPLLPYLPTAYLGLTSSFADGRPQSSQAEEANGPLQEGQRLISSPHASSALAFVHKRPPSRHAVALLCCNSLGRSIEPSEQRLGSHPLSAQIIPVDRGVSGQPGSASPPGIRLCLARAARRLSSGRSTPGRATFAQTV